MRRWRSGENEAASPVYQIVTQSGTAANVGARRSQRFPECTHLYVDPGGNPGLIRQATTLFSDYADPMRFINKKPCPEALLQLDNFGQRGAVSVNAVDGLDEEENLRIGVLLRCPPQMAFQFLEPIVREDPHRRPAESRAIHETSVTKLVQNNHVALPGQRGDRSQRRGIAA